MGIGVFVYMIYLCMYIYKCIYVCIMNGQEERAGGYVSIHIHDICVHTHMQIYTCTNTYIYIMNGQEERVEGADGHVSIHTHNVCIYIYIY